MLHKNQVITQPDAIEKLICEELHKHTNERVLTQDEMSIFIMLLSSDDNKVKMM